MNVLALSDLHLDAYLLNATDSKLKKYCESVLHLTTQPVDVITIAGDLGHYNADNQALLTYLAKTYSCQVLFTYGNHDLYITSQKQFHKYQGQSFNRTKEMKDWAKTQSNIHFLDGDYIDINGVRFGGLCNWYDGSYNNFDQLANFHWNSNFTDYFYIYKNGVRYFDFNSIRDDVNAENNLSYLVSKNCDYIFTHVCPIIDKDLIEHSYQEQRSTAFYFSDDYDTLENSKVRYLQFGHTHSSLSKHYDNMFAFNASLGYPKESKNFTPTYMAL